MYDSWGDGWNGAYANVYIDGNFVGEAELLESDGDFAFYDVTLYPGEVFELEWTRGIADSEVYFSIMDADENVIYYGEWGDPFLKWPPKTAILLDRFRAPIVSSQST